MIAKQKLTKQLLNESLVYKNNAINWSLLKDIFDCIGPSLIRDISKQLGIPFITLISLIAVIYPLYPFTSKINFRNPLVIDKVSLSASLLKDKKDKENSFSSSSFIKFKENLNKLSKKLERELALKTETKNSAQVNNLLNSSPKDSTLEPVDERSTLIQNTEEPTLIENKGKKSTLSKAQLEQLLNIMEFMVIALESTELRNFLIELFSSLYSSLPSNNEKAIKNKILDFKKEETLTTLELQEIFKGFNKSFCKHEKLTLSIQPESYAWDKPSDQTSLIMSDTIGDFPLLGDFKVFKTFETRKGFPESPIDSLGYDLGN